MRLSTFFPAIRTLVDSVLGPKNVVSNMIIDFLRKLNGARSTEWIIEAEKFLRKKPCWDWILEYPKQTPYLQQLVDAEIDRTNDTGAIPVRVYELKKKGNFIEFFTSVFPDQDLSMVCFQNKDQITAFCKKYPYLICGEFTGSLFLFKEDGLFKVKTVWTSSKLSDISIYHYNGNSLVWLPEGYFRVMIPMMITLNS